jgi:hypothetical protein
MLTGTSNPMAGGEVRTNFFKAEKDSGYEWNTPAPRLGEQDNSFSHTPSFKKHSFTPVLEGNILL